MKRRTFLETSAGTAAAFAGLDGCTKPPRTKQKQYGKSYNGPYTGPYLNRVALPIGGIGAGMICLEGSGAISHVSVRNVMQIYNEPCSFAALCIKGKQNTAKILEGPVPDWKIFGAPGTGNGAAGTSYGLPRFDEASFLTRFPFGIVTLKDSEVPLEVELTGWSPFIPGDPDNASLPVGALEYRFKNTSGSAIDAVFSYNSKNFMTIGNVGNTILPIKNGFILHQDGTTEKPENQGDYAVFIDDSAVVVDHCWFKGGWWDSLTLAWRNVREGILLDNPPVEGACPGASLFVPFKLSAGQEKTIRVMVAWYVPKTDLRLGNDPEKTTAAAPKGKESSCCASRFHVPWYAGRFTDIKETAKYWMTGYDDLRAKTKLFSDTFYDTTLPPEVVEAVAANLTILKSPTVLRTTCGRLWCFEGCSDNRGCCHGTCTHVWNYAQAIPHLFPSLERSLRKTEFNESQDERGHQTFRASLPIRPVDHTFHAASDGQLGGIMKVYREWRISGDTEWLRELWPKVKKSLEYCITTWDPRGHGVLEEPHHNTYDIEYWGPDGHCSSFYLGALTAAIEMGTALGEDVTQYRTLLEKGKTCLETELWDGEYFFQKIMTTGLNAEFKPLDVSSNGSGYKDVVDMLNTQGPKYQYGTGCLSDGVLGFWMARMCGLGEIVDPVKVRSSLKAIHTYNLKRDLSDHSNPQRPAYALGKEGGLLLCTWPKGGALSIPFVYSDEVWTGIEYQVASHLMLEGMVNEGLEIVRIARDRYDGRVRNPFNEYECGHWYARALSSWGLIQGLTGVRYDAVDNTLFIDSKVGDTFTCFIATEYGFGRTGLNRGKPFLEVRQGTIDVKKVVVSGKEMTL
ncbi:non-lysosomal glucosylceramidase [bacterium]|nr:non-lysosomal glucosylceramidase [bacterium]